MYHLGGRRRRQSLVTLRCDSSANVAGGAFREARGYVSWPLPEIFGLGERLGCILNMVILTLSMHLIASSRLR